MDFEDPFVKPQGLAVKKISSFRSALQRETGWCEVLGSGNEPALEPLWETAA